jgi:hypothetical protein
MSRVMSLALKAAQRLKIQNRKLVVAWVSIIAAVMAAGTLGYQWALTESDPLVIGGESCVSYHSGKLFICAQGQKEYLVVPMPTP